MVADGLSRHSGDTTRSRRLKFLLVEMRGYPQPNRPLKSPHVNFALLFRQRLQVADFDEKVRSTRKSPLGLETVSDFRVVIDYHFAETWIEEHHSNGISPQVFVPTFSSQSASGRGEACDRLEPVLEVFE